MVMIKNIEFEKSLKNNNFADNVKCCIASTYSRKTPFLVPGISPGK